MNMCYVGDSHLLESVQRKWTRRISGLERFSYGERLRSLRLFSVWGRMLSSDLIKHWKILC